MDDETKIKLLKDIIDLNPYNYYVFVYTIQHFEDIDCEIERLANYFGYDISPVKEEIINKVFNSINMDTENNTIEAKNKMTNLISNLGYDIKNSKELKIINDKLVEFDVAARSVGEILFESRNEADMARNQLSKVEGIYKSSDKNNKTSLINAKEKIVNLKLEPALKNKYVELIEKDIESLDIKSRTFNGTVYDTVPLKEEAKQCSKLENIFNRAKNDESALIAAKQEISQLNVRDDLKSKYIKKIDNLLQEIDLKMRSFNGVIYDTREEKSDVESRTFNGVLYDSKQEAEAARVKQLDIDKRTFDGVVYDSEKEAIKAKNKYDIKEKEEQRKKNCIIIQLFID